MIHTRELIQLISDRCQELTAVELMKIHELCFPCKVISIHAFHGPDTTFTIEDKKHGWRDDTENVGSDTETREQSNDT